MTPPASDGRIPAFLNPGAGSADDVAKVLECDDAFEIRRVEDAGRLPELVREAVEGGARRVVLSGGDGTLASGATALVGKPTEMAIVPAGTLNHFAKALGIPTEPDEAVRAAREEEARPVDVAWANDRLMLNTSSIGAYVTFVRVREWLEHHHVPYLLASILAAIRVLFSLRRYSVAVEVDGERRLYRTPLVFVAVGERELQVPTLGGRVDGGRRGLHVIVVRGRTRTSLLLIGLALAARGLRASGGAAAHGVDTFFATEMEVETRRHAVRLSVDGEVVPTESPIRYRYDPDALRVVAPPPAPPKEAVAS